MAECNCLHPLHIGICEMVVERQHIEDICGCLNSTFVATDVRELRRRDAQQERDIDALKKKDRAPRQPSLKYKRDKK